jgi:hypothetical protein
MAATGHAGIGIFDCGYNAADASLNQCFSAGARAAVVGAGFEGNIGRSTPCRSACHGKGLGFGVGPAAWLGPAYAQQYVIPDDNTAHRRILSRGA